MENIAQHIFPDGDEPSEAVNDNQDDDFFTLEDVQEEFNTRIGLVQSFNNIHGPQDLIDSPEELMEDRFRIRISKPKQLELQNITTPVPSVHDFHHPTYIQNFKVMHSIDKEKILIKSISEGNAEILETLINLGVSVHANNYNLFLHYAYKNPIPPIVIAGSFGHLNCLKVLISKGACLNTSDKFGVTALHMASQNGHLECVKLLLQSGANVNAKTTSRFFGKVPYSKRTTPLHLAASNNQIGCIEELMKAGAEYNTVDEQGISPFYVASQLGYDQCVQTLLRNAGLTILSLPSFGTGNTHLHFAVKRGLICGVKELLRLGSDVNHQNNNGDTPLHVCVKSKLCEPDVALQILKLLVLHGYNADVNQGDSYGLNPLYYAAFDTAAGTNRYDVYRRSEMANFLIAYGADINVKSFLGLSIMEHEYNSTYPDTSVMETCVQSLKVPPYPDKLECPYFTALAEHFPNNSIQFYTYLSSIRLGITPEMHRYFEQILRSRPISQEAAQKQKWYQKNVPYDCVPSLKHLCRHSIRSILGHKNLRQIKDFCIPVPIKSYLLLGQDYTVDLNN